LNEKRQPQKHATSVIVDTFLSLRPLRCGGPVTAAGPGFAGALPVWLLMRGAGAIPVQHAPPWRGCGLGRASPASRFDHGKASDTAFKPISFSTSMTAGWSVVVICAFPVELSS